MREVESIDDGDERHITSAAGEVAAILDKSSPIGEARFRCG